MCTNKIFAFEMFVKGMAIMSNSTSLLSLLMKKKSFCFQFQNEKKESKIKGSRGGKEVETETLK